MGYGIVLPKGWEIRLIKADFSSSGAGLIYVSAIDCAARKSCSLQTRILAAMQNVENFIG
jgi:hypothetical protein